MTPEQAFEEAEKRIANWKEGSRLFLNIEGLAEIPESIAGLTALTWLDCSDTQISDLSPLSGLTALTQLNCAHTQISDLSPLSGLTALTRLDCAHSQISDLSPVSGLTALTGLYCGGTQISDLSPLSGLIALEDLDIQGTQILDLRPIGYLSQLGTNRATRGFEFAKTPSVRFDAQLSKISELKNNNERTKRAQSYLIQHAYPPLSQSDESMLAPLEANDHELDAKLVEDLRESLKKLASEMLRYSNMVPRIVSVIDQMLTLVEDEKDGIDVFKLYLLQDKLKVSLLRLRDLPSIDDIDEPLLGEIQDLPTLVKVLTAQNPEVREYRTRLAALRSEPSSNERTQHFIDELLAEDTASMDLIEKGKIAGQNNFGRVSFLIGAISALLAVLLSAT